MEQKVDHRRATAERNAVAILDALERLSARGATLTMAALAAEAGVSRPTLYAHYKTLDDVLAAAVERRVAEAVAAVRAARPEEGPADEALDRVLETSWRELARFGPVARVALERMSAQALHRSHRAMLEPLRALVERGRRDGVFRTDLPVEWLIRLYVQLVHAADEHAHASRLSRAETLTLLRTTVRDLVLAR